MTDFETKFPELKGKESQGMRYKWKEMYQEEAILLREGNKIMNSLPILENDCAVFPAIFIEKFCLSRSEHEHLIKEYKEVVRQTIKELRGRHALSFTCDETEENCICGDVILASELLERLNL